jgi:hypothetical protein
LDRRVTVLAELRTDAVVVACAVSAGIHGALVPQHFAEGAGAGLGFLGAAAVLAALAVTLTRFPTSSALLATTAAVFVGLLGSYALAVTTGVPFLHPHPEPVDGLALFTKAVEATGLLLISTLLWRPVVAIRVPQPKGTPR